MEVSVMTEDRLRSYGVLLLRVALGTMFIAHSMVYMLMTLTLDGTAKFFVSMTAGLARLCDVLGRGGRWNTPHSGYPDTVGGAGAFADPDRCDLGSFRKRLALCRHQRWLGVPSLPLRSLHCASHAHRRRLRACPVAVEGQVAPQFHPADAASHRDNCH